MRNPYAVFETEIAERVLGPRILACVHTSPTFVTSLVELRTLFNARYGCQISMPTLKRWMRLANITFSKSVQIRGPDTEPPQPMNDFLLALERAASQTPNPTDHT